MDVLAFPFSLTVSGEVATVTQGSDEYVAQLIASVALTRRGERALLPTYGTADPTFTAFDVAELEGAIELHMPNLTRVVDATVEYPTETTEHVVINFE